VTESAQSPFLDAHGKPQLCRCALVFIDLLGVRAMATGPEAGKKLVELREALQRPLGDLLSPSSPWLASFFSDTLVLVDPVQAALPPHQAMGGLAIQAASLQINLAVSGFFLRGAMTCPRRGL